ATATAVAASAVMAVALVASAAAWPPSQQVLVGFVRTGLLVALGGAVYLGVAWALRSPELGELLRIRRA
ncbi:MAG: hypothetical protein M3425_06580, partial [Actinomycetota bacterium]|nr:hypothetical protein [Actinomycetota bacterium]